MNETRPNSYGQNKNKSKEVKYKKHVFNLQQGGFRKRAKRERERERERGAEKEAETGGTYFV